MSLRLLVSRLPSVLVAVCWGSWQSSAEGISWSPLLSHAGAGCLCLDAPELLSTFARVGISSMGGSSCNVHKQAVVSLSVL